MWCGECGGGGGGVGSMHAHSIASTCDVAPVFVLPHTHDAAEEASGKGEHEKVRRTRETKRDRWIERESEEKRGRERERERESGR